MFLLQSSGFDPTNYGQEDYLNQLGNYQNQQIEHLRGPGKSDDPFQWARDMENLSKEFEGYRSGYGTYQQTQDLLPEDYDPSIESAENLGWAEDILKQMAEGSGGIADKFRTRATTDVNKAFGRRRDEFDEMLAQTGLGRSGVGSAVKSELAGEQAEALSDVDLSAEQLETDVNFQVISQLLGIDQMRVGAGQFDIGVAQREDQFSKSMIQDLMKFNEQMAFEREQFKWQQEQAEFDFWRDLGTPLLTGAVSGFGYGWGSRA